MSRYSGRVARGSRADQRPSELASNVEKRSCSTTPAELEADRRPLARRYFGPELGDDYVADNDGEGMLKFSMRPTRWWPVDWSSLP